MISSDKDLLVLDHNRVVKDLNNLKVAEFISKIKENFKVTELDEVSYKLHKKGTFGMDLNFKWYELKVNKKLAEETDIVKSLDVSILHDYIIRPILGIDDPRNDKRIDFVGGIRGIGELERRVNEDMQVAFSIYK